MKFTPLAVIALFLAAACGGNKENANNPNGSPPTTTDTSAGQMSPSTNPTTTPSTTPAPSAQPATPPTTMDTTSHMTPPDTNMKKMSGRRHHKASDTTTH